MRELDEQTVRARYRFFEAAGPSHALPLRCAMRPAPVGRFRGAVYVGLYPADAFEDLADFGLFQWFTSSIQQDLFSSGHLNLSYFYPESIEEALPRILRQAELDRAVLTTSSRFLQTLGGVSLWVPLLEPIRVIEHLNDGELDLRAECKEGYLTAFSVEV